MRSGDRQGVRRRCETGPVPIDAGSLHYTVGPIIAVVVVCLLGLLLRWVFGSGRSRAAATVQPTGTPADHGLLRAVAVLPGRPAANALRAVLSDAGIRSTASVLSDGRVELLVFPDDVERARRLVPPPR